MAVRARRSVRVTGRVQGVGFRPWAARLARSLEVAGTVCNAGDGVRIAIEGDPHALDAFLCALRDAPPTAAAVERIDVASEDPRGERGFAITASCDTGGSPARLRIPPDAPLCAACLDELFDPQDRRYRHPFAHCATCGPRAAVIEALPYDRARTSLRHFPLCAACQREYGDPADRRHHAESIACPDCGPTLRACMPDGSCVPGDPIERAVEVLRAGGVVAMKGNGGFHLVADATNQDAVLRLRERKGRPTKPFAVLVPDLATAQALVALSHLDAALLASSERPVVVAPRRAVGAGAHRIADAVAPGIEDLGVILPYAPLQWLLFFAPGATPARDRARLAPLLFSSANRSGEPTLHCGDAARRELATVVDLFLDHDRAVVRPNDDPVHRSAAGGPIPIRLSRGSTPRVLRLPSGVCAREPIVAVGGDLKAAPAVLVGDEIVLAEHVGDLASASAADALLRRVADLCRLLGVVPAVAVHDLHPDAVGAQLAARLAPRVLAVQHHHAHAAACLIEHGRSGPALALALDGMGFGSDGTLWGGELLRVELDRSERLAHLETVPLPGGDAAAREPWRMAAVWLARAFPTGAPTLP
jgi:hydrogenase maturation protein HypF